MEYLNTLPELTKEQEKIKKLIQNKNEYKEIQLNDNEQIYQFYITQIQSNNRTHIPGYCKCMKTLYNMLKSFLISINKYCYIIILLYTKL